jgi:hypothetical protein
VVTLCGLYEIMSAMGKLYLQQKFMTLKMSEEEIKASHTNDMKVLVNQLVMIKVNIFGWFLLHEEDQLKIMTK